MDLLESTARNRVLLGILPIQAPLALAYLTSSLLQQHRPFLLQRHSIGMQLDL